MKSEAAEEEEDEEIIIDLTTDLDEDMDHMSVGEVFDGDLPPILPRPNRPTIAQPPINPAIPPSLTKAQLDSLIKTQIAMAVIETGKLALDKGTVCRDVSGSPPSILSL